MYTYMCVKERHATTPTEWYRKILYARNLYRNQNRDDNVHRKKNSRKREKQNK